MFLAFKPLIPDSYPYERAVELKCCRAVGGSRSICMYQDMLTAAKRDRRNTGAEREGSRSRKEKEHGDVGGTRSKKEKNKQGEVGVRRNSRKRNHMLKMKHGKEGT